MNGFDAIRKVKTELDNMDLSLTGGIYQFSKPVDNDDDEYVEINVLAIPQATLQIANVNVNIYVKDVVVGTPDNGRLETLHNEIESNLPITRGSENIHVFWNGMSILPDIDNNRHYVNMRLLVILLN
jgi:hypothetical protein